MSIKRIFLDDVKYTRVSSVFSKRTEGKKITIRWLVFYGIYKKCMNNVWWCMQEQINEYFEFMIHQNINVASNKGIVDDPFFYSWLKS